MNIDDGSLVKFLIGANCTKYDVLNDLFQDIDLSRYRNVTLLVDGHTVVSRLYHNRKIASVYAGSSAEMVRDLVVGFTNVLAHYRRYMASRMHLDNTIFVMFNRAEPTYNRRFCHTFNRERIERYDPNDPINGFTSQILDVAWGFVMGLSPFFERIYCLDNSGMDDFALMDRMDFDDDTLVLVLSTNVYATQLLRKNWIQIHPKRDKTYLITRKTCYKNGILKDVKYNASEKLTPEMLPLIWSIVGCDSMDVPGLNVCSLKSLIHGMEKMADDGILTEKTTISGFLENLPSYVSLHVPQFKSSKSDIEDRYRALSTRLSSLAITNDQLTKIAAQVYDIYNQNELEQLNEILVQGRLDPEILQLENLNMSAGEGRDDFDGWE